MCSGAGEEYAAARCRNVFHAVDQQEIATNMTFAVPLPFTLECVIFPFGAERRVIGDEQQHLVEQLLLAELVEQVNLKALELPEMQELPIEAAAVAVVAIHLVQVVVVVQV